MADEKRSSGPPGGKRRRPPATIDLKATEITSDPVQPAKPVDPTDEIAAAEAQPTGPSPAGEAAAEPAHASSQPRLETTLDEAGPSPTGSDAGATNGRLSGLRGLAQQTNGRLIAVGLAGSIATLLLILVLWIFGPLARDTGPLEARLAALETQAHALAARPAPASLDPGALAALDARLAKAEQAVAAPRPAQPDQALASRVAALEASTRPLSELGQRLDGANAMARDAKARADAAFEAAQKNVAQPAAQAADHKEIEALAARVAALEQATKAVDDKIAHAVRSAEADRAGRLAFVASALRSAVERGEPFARELAAARSLVADASALAPLEPFAAAGVPRAATLARELAQLAGPMLGAAGRAPREGGIFDRLQQNAERLVRIRPISEAPGDDPATIVARAEARAAQGDIAGARSELAQLPEAARAPAQAWIQRAEAQVAALAAARKLADNALGALAKAAP